MITITNDYVSESPRESSVGLAIESMPLYGVEVVMGEGYSIPNDGPLVRFHLRDDDGELLYCGTLTNDNECINQLAALRWGERMAGATTIYVKKGSEYVQEIG